MIYCVINDLNSKKKYQEAVVLNYDKKSNDRVNPICPYYEECGGCDLMHLSKEKQKENEARGNIYYDYKDKEAGLAVKGA